MTATAESRRMSYADYCERERTATIEHEYLRGEVFGMTGGTPQRTSGTNAIDDTDAPEA